nr:MAG TPA: hypothetical protein [Caudoviricetes sp.]
MNREYLDIVLNDDGTILSSDSIIVNQYSTNTIIRVGFKNINPDVYVYISFEGGVKKSLIPQYDLEDRIPDIVGATFSYQLTQFETGEFSTEKNFTIEIQKDEIAWKTLPLKFGMKKATFGMVTKIDSTKDSSLESAIKTAEQAGKDVVDLRNSVYTKNESDKRYAQIEVNPKTETDNRLSTIKINGVDYIISGIKGATGIGINSLKDVNLTFGDSTKLEYDKDEGIQLDSTGRFTYFDEDTKQDEFKDVPINLDIPIIGTDGITIDKADNDEKIEISGKNFRKVVTGASNEIKVYVTKYGDIESWMFLNSDPDGAPGAEIPQYGTGGTLRANMPTTVLDNSVVNKKYADANYIGKIGGTITGSLVIGGNLFVNGSTSTTESTTLKVSDKLIYVAKDNTAPLTSPAGLITPKYDGTNDGGLVYDNSGTAYIGDIKLDTKGNVDVSQSDLQPIATRDSYSNFTNGHKVKAEVDSTQKNIKFIDGGVDDGINSLTDVNLTLGDTTVQYDTDDGIQMTSTGRFTYAEGNKDATIDLDIPLIGTDGIVIDKASGSEKIEVSGKNLIKDPYPGVNVTGAGIVNYKPYGSADWGSAFIRNTHGLVDHAESGAITGYDNNGVLYAKTTSDDDYSVVNRKYADENYCIKPEPYTVDALIAIHANGEIFVKHIDDLGSVPNTIAQVYTNNAGDTKPYSTGVLITNDPTQPYQCANKKYVDDSVVNIPLKTLFGNQNIHGTGNIDLYRHNIHISAGVSGFGAEIYFTYYSSKNLQVDSLTDLKTLMGDEFTEAVSGNTSTNLPVLYITQTGFRVQASDYTWAGMSAITITDTVTTI